MRMAIQSGMRVAEKEEGPRTFVAPSTPKVLPVQPEKIHVHDPGNPAIRQDAQASVRKDG